jgi:3-oxoacyl-[acyl-carrier protein] reductase
MRLREKVAVVTGASGGLGGGICGAFAREGADCLVAYYKNREGAEATAAAVCELGRRAEIFQVDVADEGQVRAMIQAALDAFGRLDIAVANAGIGVRVPFMQSTPEQFDQVVATNLRGAYLTLRYAAEPMVKAGGGKLITISSIHGLGGSHLFSLYAATKAGIIGLTRGTAFDLADDNIQVNCVAPGAVPVARDGEFDHNSPTARAWYDHTPMNRMGRLSDVAAGAVYLASSDSDWVTGQVLAIDGGASAGRSIPNMRSFSS